MPQFAPAGAAIAAGGLNIMAIIRGAVGLIALLLAFLPWLDFTYTGIISGTSSASWNLFDMASDKIVSGWVMPVYVIAAVVLIASAVVEIFARIDVCKWVSLGGAAVTALVAVFFAINGDAAGAGSIGVASVAYSPTVIPWLAAILGIGGAATCFFKL